MLRPYKSYSTGATSKSRTSTKWPAMAAAAAISGLTRCVRCLALAALEIAIGVLALRSSAAGRPRSFRCTCCNRNAPLETWRPLKFYRGLLFGLRFDAREPGTTSACFMVRATCLPDYELRGGAEIVDAGVVWQEQ